jgi:hypothetical protein
METMKSDSIPRKSEMLLARAELYRSLAEVGAVDLREGRLAMAAYLERLARAADAAGPVAAQRPPHPAPERH